MNVAATRPGGSEQDVVSRRRTFDPTRNPAPCIFSIYATPDIGRKLSDVSYNECPVNNVRKRRSGVLPRKVSDVS